jgi:uncharacterized protein
MRALLVTESVESGMTAGGWPRRALIGLLTVSSVLCLAVRPIMAQLSPLTAPTLPTTIALFPLPNIAVMPYQELPLRVFEPRYQAMLRDALAGDRIIGMIQIQPGFEAEYLGQPPLFRIGTAVVVVRADTRPNGESEIVVRAFTKFRILEEVESRPYRRAKVDPITEPLGIKERELLARERDALETAFAASLGVDRSTLQMPPLSDEVLVATLVMSVDFDTIDRQLLIEQPGIVERAHKLIELLTKAAQPRGRP